LKANKVLQRKALAIFNEELDHDKFHENQVIWVVCRLVSNNNSNAYVGGKFRTTFKLCQPVNNLFSP